MGTGGRGPVLSIFSWSADGCSLQDDWSPPRNQPNMRIWGAGRTRFWRNGILPMLSSSYHYEVLQFGDVYSVSAEVTRQLSLKLKWLDLTSQRENFLLVSEESPTKKMRFFGNCPKGGGGCSPCLFVALLHWIWNGVQTHVYIFMSLGNICHSFQQIIIKIHVFFIVIFKISISIVEIIFFFVW